MSDLFVKARHAYLPAMAIGNVQVTVRGDGATSDECPKCCVAGVKFNLFKRGNFWRFKCDGCNAQGDTIDYMSIAAGLPARAAALKIIEIQPVINIEQSELVDREARGIALYEVSRRLYHLGHTSVKEVLLWASKFGLKEQDLINLALEGRVKMLPTNMPDAMKRLDSWIGKDLLVKSGLWKDGSKCPAIAFRHLIMFSRDRKAIEFMSIEEGAPSLLYGELSSPIVVASNEFSHDVLLVNNGTDGLKAIGAGFHGSVWDAPNGNWRSHWFWEYSQEHPSVQFNLTRLPETTAAEVAAMLQSKNIAFK